MESRNITVFHAGNCLIKYRKLSMGTKPASGELAKALTPLFQHIPGAHVIQDDVIIAGKNQIEHDKALHEALRMVSR